MHTLVQPARTGRTHSTQAARTPRAGPCRAERHVGRPLPRIGCPLRRIVVVTLRTRAGWSAILWLTKRRVVACLATRPAAKPLPPCHDTIVCIMTRLANQTARLSRYKDCIVTQPLAASPSLMSRYKICIVTHSTSQAARAHYRTPLCVAGRVVA